MPTDSPDKFDDQLNIRCFKTLRARLRRYVGPNNTKDVDVARLLLEFGLKAAEDNGGFFKLQGMLERKVKIRFSSETIEELNTDNQGDEPKAKKPKT